MGLISFPSLEPATPRLPANSLTEPPAARQIIWYTKTDLLPPLSPLEEEPQIKRSAKRPSPAVPGDVSRDSRLLEGEKSQLAEIRAPGLSVAEGPPSGAVAPAVEHSSERLPPASEDFRKLLARATHPTLGPEMPRGQAIEAEFFGSRRVYTVYLNMANFSNGSGSWVLRFAELEEEGKPHNDGAELAIPEAVRKVDPMYVPSAAREKVEGTVTLAALVLRNGTVANIRVMRGLDPRLDVSAVAALTRWQFQPASKDGEPVDLEVLIQIPFQIASF